MGSGKVSLPLFEGKGLFLGSKEIELERLIPRGEFLSGICFGHSLPSSSVSCPVTKVKQPAFKLPHNKENSELSNPVDQVTTGAAPQDITNYSLHWTANWCAYIFLFKFLRSYVVGGNVKNERTRHGTGTHTFRLRIISSLWWRRTVNCGLEYSGNRVMTTLFLRMGSVPWKGQSLHAGFNIVIAGKEVELDSAVSASLLPKLSECETPPDRPSTSCTIVDPEPASSKQFIPPMRFYGTPKPKVKGPRCVNRIYTILPYLHATSQTWPKCPRRVGDERANQRAYEKIQQEVIQYVCRSIDSFSLNLTVTSQLFLSLLIQFFLQKWDHIRGKVKASLSVITSDEWRYSKGVQFLYECVMGMRKFEGMGCILADEMWAWYFLKYVLSDSLLGALGKLFRYFLLLCSRAECHCCIPKTIALVWTLISSWFRLPYLSLISVFALEQNPYAEPLGVVQKVLIVCPVSLVNVCDLPGSKSPFLRTFQNWKAEFYKWLGRDRLGIVACDKANTGIDTFSQS